MGVVVYGNEAYKEINLNQYDTLEAFNQAVGNIGYLDQSTNTASGIRVARTELFTPANGRYKILIVTEYQHCFWYQSGQDRTIHPS